MILKKLLGQENPEQALLSETMYNILGVKTKNIYIYALAFRHRSVSEHQKGGVNDTYERLEFLGDAVLGLVVAEYLFKKFPFKDEGFLTNLRAKIVCGKNLTKISQKLGFEKFVHVSQGIGNTMSSVLGDVLEAVIGAIYLDKGFSYAKKVIIDRIIAFHLDLEVLVETETNFKSRLIEWGQRERLEVSFRLKETKTVHSRKQYLVEVIVDGNHLTEAIHNSIKEGEQLAAEKAIELLRERNQY